MTLTQQSIMAVYVAFLLYVIIHSGFFRLKYSLTIAEQKKLHKDGFLWRPSFKKKIPSDHGDMVTRYAGAGRV
jgi:hypothetical protein